MAVISLHVTQRKTTHSDVKQLRNAGNEQKLKSVWNVSGHLIIIQTSDHKKKRDNRVRKQTPEHIYTHDLGPACAQGEFIGSGLLCFQICAGKASFTFLWPVAHRQRVSPQR